MAASTPSLTPSRSASHTTTVAPNRPAAVVSSPLWANKLAPIAAAASILRPSLSPRPGKLPAPPFGAKPQTGAAALEELKQSRALPEPDLRADSRTSPNPGATAVSDLLGQSRARYRPAPASEQMAQMVQGIEIDGHAQSDMSSVSMPAMRTLEPSTAAGNATAGPVMGPTLAANSENPYVHDDPDAPRPTVDAGIPGDARAFTFPPPPAEDPRSPQRNMSLPMSLPMGSPRSSSARRHKCPYCSTVFTRHHNLKSHLLTHSQEKPYECQQCQNRFRRLHDLKRHTKLHTGERPHECLRCGRKFARGDALARHNKGHGGCAGRRPSFGPDAEDGEGRCEQMSGIEYTAEPDQMDDDDSQERRPAESAARPRQDSIASNPYRAGPNSYPPPAMSNNLRGGPVAPMYPPTPRDISLDNQRDNSRPHANNANNANNASHPPPLPHFTHSGPGVLQGGVTESPKPISPGQPSSQRGSVSAPSGASSFAFGRTGSGPQLPPLPQNLPNPHGSMPPPTGSQPSSLSSHSGSGASRREILGQTEPTDWWAQIRDMELRMTKLHEDNLATVARVQSDHARLESELRAQISRLVDENKALRTVHDAELQRLQNELTSTKALLAEAVKA